jgi:pyruvate/2-oxoglutarate dehydrogenase complex dihydrolipoamide acyltransferase (E2) component
MGRSRSSSSSSGSNKRFFGTSTASKPAATRTAQPTHAQPPAPVQHAPTPQHQQAPMAAAPAAGGGLLSGLGSTLMQGMAFGGGSAIAHRVVDGIAGPRTMQVEHVNSNGSSSEVASASNSLLTSSPNAVDSASASKSNANSLSCGEEVQQFQQCMTSNNNDFNKCQFMFDALSSCQRAAKENARW